MDGEYVSVKEAAGILRVSERQVQKHAASGRVQSRTEGRRLFVLREDVEKLAEEVGAHLRDEPAKEGELVFEQTGAFLDYIRGQEAKLTVLSHRVGELEAENRMMREENERLRVQQGRVERPWLARLLTAAKIT